MAHLWPTYGTTYGTTYGPLMEQRNFVPEVNKVVRGSAEAFHAEADGTIRKPTWETTWKAIMGTTI